jgi:predicted nucleotidyltransferase
MAKVARDPERIAKMVVEDLRGVFGEGLLLVALYGSAARGEYAPGRSDINLFVVVDSLDEDRLKPLIRFLPRWRRWRVRLPRIVSRKYVERSLDAFPLEFLSIKLFHKSVYGQDFLSDLAIPEDHLRLQCERELKGKVLHLQELYLLSAGKRSRMEQLIRASLPTFATVFEGLAYLKGEVPPRERAELFRKVAGLFGLQAEVFERLLAVRSGRLKLRPAELDALCREYVRQIRILSEWVDQME